MKLRTLMGAAAAIALLWAGSANAVSLSYDPADGTLSDGGTTYTSDVIPVDDTVSLNNPLTIWIFFDRHLLFVEDPGGINLPDEEITSITLQVTNLTAFGSAEDDPQLWDVEILLTGPFPFGYSDTTDCLNSAGGVCDPFGDTFDATGDDLTDGIFKWTDLHLTITVLECEECDPYRIDSLQFVATANSFDIPEPGTLGLLGAGLTAMGLFWRRRRPRLN